MSKDKESAEKQDEKERRLHITVFNQWQSLLTDGPYPKPGDMKERLHDEARDHSFIIDLTPDFAKASLNFVGGKLEAEHGGEDSLVGKKISELGHYSIINRLANHFMEVLSNRAPLGFEAEFDRPGGLSVAYRGILLPLSEDGEVIDFILGVIGWIDRSPDSE